METQYIEVRPIPVIMVSHIGPYEGIGSKFEQLWKWIGDNGIPATRSIGIYYDNPDFVPANRLRSAACAELPEGYRVTAPGNPGIFGFIAGGTYVATRYVGPYESLAPVWAEFTKIIENQLHRTIREADPAFEVYVNDPEITPPAELVTDLFMPIQ